MGVIIELGIRLFVIDVAIGIVIPLIELFCRLDQLPDDIIAGIGQHTMTFKHLGTRRLHTANPVIGQNGEIDRFYFRQVGS